LLLRWSFCIQGSIGFHAGKQHHNHTQS
jgi:hypothetical protein